jgi:hypothetical protein
MKHRRARTAIQLSEDVSRVIQLLKEHPSESLNALCDELSLQLRIQLPSERICMNWDEIQEMSTHGISFGSHSCTHAILTQMAPALVQNELAASKRILESHRVNFTPVFCYPNGSFDPRVKSLVQAADYHAAVTTQYGAEPLTPTDRFAIRRIALHQDVARTSSLLTLRLVGTARPHTEPIGEVACKSQ